MTSDTVPQVPDLDLLRRIGQGGFGEVWLAVNRTTGRLRAVKLIPLKTRGPSNAASREIVSLTYLESQIGNEQPNLLGIHHVGRTTDYLFYIMDLADDVSGRPASSDPSYRPSTLASRLDCGPLVPDECLRCARQLLAGLAHLHVAGMVHRDVKPANCLFIGGELKLADFGLLTTADPLVSRIGTVAYMPPDGRMDARADVYAAGLVIYEMLTGLSAESFPRLGQRGTEIADDRVLCQLNRLVLRACQGDPHSRYADAREMLAALDFPKPKTRRRLARPIAIALAAVLLIAALAIGLWPARPPRVEVNFITQPFEATIEIDGALLLKPDGSPYTTPCTVSDLTAADHHTVFKHDGLDDLDAGRIDFAKTRELVARWAVSK
ncbi:MAG: serine/threonine-protein kinase [Thermoguttaceae bacterium]